MKPLIVLLISFALSLLVLRVFSGRYDLAPAARIALSVMLVFTAIAHFVYTPGMILMMPPFIPFKREVVLVTGVLEVLAATGLLLPRLRELTGWMLMLFFVLLLPANVHAAVKGVDYQKANLQGSGVAYLWFRVPLQVLFMAWTYIAVIRN